MAWNPTPPPRPSHRLYYDDQGVPIVYSQETLAGNYIEVDPVAFALANYDVRVIDQKIVPLAHTHVRKLKPSDRGTPCHPCNVSVVDTSSKTFWKKQ